MTNKNDEVIGNLIKVLTPFAKAYERIEYFGDPTDLTIRLFATDENNCSYELLDDIEGEPLTIHNLREAAKALEDFK